MLPADSLVGGDGDGATIALATKGRPSSDLEPTPLDLHGDPFHSWVGDGQLPDYADPAHALQWGRREIAALPQHRQCQTQGIHLTSHVPAALPFTQGAGELF